MLGLVILGILLTLAVYALLVEPTNVRKREFTLSFPDLPQEFDGLRIAHMSDLHLRRIGTRERKLIELIKEDPPDLIVVTGDLISRSRDMDECLSLLAECEARIGIWAVQGNWEHKTGWVGEKLREGLKEVGITLLINEAESVSLEGENLTIIGMDDPSLGLDDLPKALGDCDGGFKILLAHSPEILPDVPESVRLVLSGHTHGGQIRLPLIGAPWGKALGHGYLSGIYHHGQTVLYVTRGIGMTWLPLRFLCPPEVAYITLKRGED